jgi:hypothetical protein
MSDLYEDDDNDSTLVKQLRKQLRDLKKSNDDLTTENSKLSTQVRAKSVEEILTSKGADKRLAKYIPADVNDEAGVSAWLDSDGDLFGYKAGEAGDGDDSGGLPPEAQAAAQQVANTTSGGKALADRQRQQLEAVRNAKTKEELDALVFGAQSGN